MEDNTEWAYAQLKDTTKHVLLTGPAGSGKSTLIRKFIEEHEGEVLVCASTGIAAVNIGGVTIHKLFSFPIVPIGYKQIQKLGAYEGAPDALKRKLFLAAKYIIIDEISMTPAWVMDQISWYLHKNFGDFGPFGGKKIIMVGDIDQLPPVVTDQDRENIMAKRGYNSAYFFDAACWNPERHASFETVKLTKVWRQSDPDFISLLNDIKSNNVSPLDVDRLNGKCYHATKDNGGVLLCSTNKIANETNTLKLAEATGKALTLEGKLTGEFPESARPVSLFIELKEGCRVMTTANHQVKMGETPDYVNGSIGTFIRRDENKIIIKFDGSDLETEVARFQYDNIDYSYDEVKHKIIPKVIGVFIQFPIKLAYALTIHKSQGQSFDKIIVDMGSRGAFAHGQTYVALSRCRSMEGIVLRQRLTLSDFIYDKDVLEFNKK
jgi:ATP-dependent DNA helicase PIF1